jgi:hypothetical protein
MVNFELSINALTFLFIVLGAAFTGYVFRSRQIKKKQSKIQDLRKEIVWNHAQILELQKEYVALESQVKVTQAPVLPLNLQVIDYMEETKKVSDGFM